MENIKTDVLLLFASPYSIVDEKSGQVNEGVSCIYSFNSTLQPTNENGVKGVRTAKVSLPLEVYKQKIWDVPAIYSGSFSYVVGSNMQPVLKLVDVDFKHLVEVVEKKPLTNDDIEKNNSVFKSK